MENRQPSQAHWVSVVKDTTRCGRWKPLTRLLKGGALSDNIKKSIAYFVSKHANEATLHSLLPHFQPTQLNTVLRETVKRHLWKIVAALLDRCAAGDVTNKLFNRTVISTQLALVIQEAIQHAGEEDLQTLLPYCPDDQVVPALHMAVSRGLWSSVRVLMRREVSDDEKTKVILEAARRRKDSLRILPEIISSCSQQQLDSALDAALSERLWPAVCFLSGRDVSDAMRSRAVLEYIQYKQYIIERLHVISHKGLAGHTSLHTREHAKCQKRSVILKLCTRSQVDAMLEELLSRRLWSCVIHLLKHGTTNTCHAVEEAIRHADSESLESILPHCTDDQLDPVLVEAVSRGLWCAVIRLLGRGPDEALRRWAVEEASKRADENTLVLIMTDHYWDEDQYGALLTQVTERGLWRTVSVLLGLGVTNEKRAWAVLEACRRASETDLKVLFERDFFCFNRALYMRDLPMEDVTNILIDRGKWEILRSISGSGNITAYQKMLILNKMSMCASSEELESILTSLRLPSDDFQHALLVELLNRQQWSAIKNSERLLRWWKSSASTRLLFEKAINDSNKSHLEYLVRNRSVPDDMLDRVVRDAIQHSVWKIIPSVFFRLEMHVGSWAVEHAIERAGDDDLSLFIGYCDDSQVDIALTKAVSRHMWDSLKRLLWRVRDDSRVQWAVEKASKHATDDQLLPLLPHCTHRQLDYVLADAVRRGLWMCVSALIPRVLENKRCRWGVEVSKRASDEVLAEFVRKINWNEDTRGLMLQEAVRRGLWESVLEVLHLGVPQEQRDWAVLEASKQPMGHILIRILFRYCTDPDLLNSVLKNVLDRKLWGVAKTLVVEKYVSGVQESLIIRKLYKHADEEILEAFLTVCPEDSLDYAVTMSVKRGMWKTIITQLSRPFCFSFSPVSEAVRRFAVEEAVTRASDAHCSCVVFLCFDDQLDTIVTRAVKRGLWETLASLLSSFHLSDTVRKQVVEEARKRAGNEQFGSIATHCTEDQLDCVLAEITRRHMWKDLENILNNGVTIAQLQLAVMEAVRFADEMTVLNLTRRNRLDLDPILRVAVSRGLWSVVVTLLQGAVCEDRSRPVGGCGRGRGGWEALIDMKRVVSKDTRMWVVENIIRFAPNGRVVGILTDSSILSQCEGDELDSLITRLVSFRQWDRLGSVLKCGVSQSKRRWAMGEASKHAKKKKLRKLLPHCTEDQVNTVMTELVKRCLWECVGDLLCREGLSSTLRTRACEEAGKYADKHFLSWSYDTFIRAARHFPECRYALIVGAVGRGVPQWSFDILSSPVDVHMLDAAVDKAVRFWGTDLDLNLAVKQAVLSGFWSLVSSLLQYTADSHALRRWAANKICQNHPYSLSLGDLEFGRIIQYHSEIGLALKHAVMFNYPRTTCDILASLRERDDISQDPSSDPFLTALGTVIKIKNSRPLVVAECIKLGVSTHQPIFTDSMYADSDGISPFKYATLMNDERTAWMLYESGSCYEREVFKLSEDLTTWTSKNDEFLPILQKISIFLMTAASTPRTLKSLCRLVISHHLGVGCRRQERMKQLGLPANVQEYVLFSNILTEVSRFDEDRSEAANDVASTSTFGTVNADAALLLLRMHFGQRHST